MHGCITRRAPNPERNIELLRYLVACFGVQVARILVAVVVNHLTMVRHEDDNSIAVGEAFHNLRKHLVVIEHSIVVVREVVHVELAQVRTLVMAWVESPLVLRIAHVIHEMQSIGVKHR